MKLRLFQRLVAFVLLLTAAHAGTRDPLWRAVAEAENRGLPKTAITQLEAIIAAALADRAYAEATKAVLLKVTLESGLVGNNSGEAIPLFSAELAKAPEGMKPLMEAILAHWYTVYWQQHRWSLRPRAAAVGAPSSDFRTWDLPQLTAAIEAHYAAALANQVLLKVTPVSAYGDLLLAGTAPDRYRPTMYDFVADDELEFFAEVDRGPSAPEDEFAVGTAGPMLGSIDEFMAWKPSTADTASPKFKAVRLYQELLAFHRKDADRSAFFDLDLGRLAYGHRTAVGPDLDDRYKAALRRFIGAASRHEISARATAMLGTQLVQDDEAAAAHSLVLRAAADHPGTFGATQCLNLAKQIEAKSVAVATERIWNAPWPTIDVTYANITRVYFRAIPFEFDAALALGEYGYAAVGRLRDPLRTAAPALAWTAELPPTGDFRPRTEKLAAPRSLPPGFYYIMVSGNPAFSPEDNVIAITPVWVSNLALVLRYDSHSSGGLVLRADSGAPVAGATVRTWDEDRDGRWTSRPEVIVTDGDGRFQLTGDRRQVVVEARDGTQAVAAAYANYVGSFPRTEPEQEQVVFLTDRSLYRPGQTISYKGIALRFDHAKGLYAVAAGKEVTVLFDDTNGHEIARAVHTTSDYGSFSGTFEAPRDRLTGFMSIVTQDGSGRATVSVEEYKRPKFEVTLQEPELGPRLGSPVNMGGMATAFTGAPIGGGRVRWAVQRVSIYPSWCWWRPLGAAKNLAHGSTVTAADGTFAVPFTAEPDLAVPAADEPVFNYLVTADVTDTTGESRSSTRSLAVGYAALQASLAADDWQTPAEAVQLEVSTSALDGDPQPAAGTITYYALRPPDAIVRPAPEPNNGWRTYRPHGEEDPAFGPQSWALGEMVAKQAFTSDREGKAHVSQRLAVGAYRAMLETADRLGRKVTARWTIEVVDPSATTFALRLPNRLVARHWSAEPGETFTALWGTGYPAGRALVELVKDGAAFRRFWTSAGSTQEIIAQPVEEDLRGGFTLRVTYVRENRAYLSERKVEVPWSSKRLAVKWEHFRSKLLPGGKETWTAVITGPDGKGAPAELAADLYDASLDQFRDHDWPEGFGVYRDEDSYLAGEFSDVMAEFRLTSNWRRREEDDSWYYRGYSTTTVVDAEDDVVALSPFSVEASGDRGGYRANATLAGTRVRTDLKYQGESVSVVTGQFLQDSAAANTREAVDSPARTGRPGPDLETVAARSNLAETAFFFPQLPVTEDGKVRIEFALPDSLTRWKFLGFAHDRSLRSGRLTAEAVTAKDLMVEPNPPRFLREGDLVEFTVKVSNRTNHPADGRVKLAFRDAASLRPVDQELGNTGAEREFSIPGLQSRSYSWRIAVPDGMGFLSYRVVGGTADASDGEEGYLPVLSRRTLVTESLELPIRGKAVKQFEMPKLLASGGSATLRSQSLTVQMVSNPSWYAVLALPYLMEFPYECSEQLFNRLYANELARHIAQSDPKIRRIFDLWKGTATQDSPLEKNPDLKSAMIEETPWVREATDESNARRRVGLLFDSNRLDRESSAVRRQLTDRQLPDGLWSWYPGGESDSFISLYIAVGFGRLRHLGVPADAAPAIRAWGALDHWLSGEYARIEAGGKPEDYVPGYTTALYLYGRSFFLREAPIPDASREALEFFLRQARKKWPSVVSRQCQAQLALALERFGDRDTPQAILRSLKERSLDDEESGMHWADPRGWYWYQAPIETQAMMIEAFSEISADSQAVEDCKIWLIKQKQTQNWPTTKASGDAVYALLLNGSNPLSNDSLVEVSLGGERIEPERVEAGTGFYERKFVKDEVRPAMGRIAVTRTTDGLSWGGLHWQYLEDISKVSPHEPGPLSVKKSLYVKEDTSRGKALRAVSGPLSVGDELVVRLEVRADRDLEYLHLRDQRASGTEPVDVLSGYHFQDRLGFYQSTRDTATDFFISHLSKGVHVLEYSVRVQLRGRYQGGMATLECMYAPEFNSHTASPLLEVK